MSRRILGTCPTPTQLLKLFRRKPAPQKISANQQHTYSNGKIYPRQTRKRKEEILRNISPSVVVTV
ncbi:MAG: hypothetical protein QW468_05025 [Candidatus Bathyarchaeia archaeon]